MNARPVRRWENECLDGDVLSGDLAYEEKRAEVENRREQHAAYLASLPTDPAACIAAAAGVMHPDSGEFMEGFEEALHLSFALEPMIRGLDTDAPGPERDALLYVADRVRWGLERSARQLEHVSDILCSPARIERERRRDPRAYRNGEAQQ